MASLFTYSSIKSGSQKPSPSNKEYVAVRVFGLAKTFTLVLPIWNSYFVKLIPDTVLNFPWEPILWNWIKTGDNIILFKEVLPIDADSPLPL